MAAARTACHRVRRGVLWSRGMRWFGVRLQLLLTALIVLLAAAASAPSHYFCKMTGRAVAECCCASELGPKAHRTARAEAPDCCELRSASHPPVVVSHNAAVPELPVASLAATLPVLVYPEPTFRLLGAVPSAARAPPAIGPPLFISHCALLI